MSARPATGCPCGLAAPYAACCGRFIDGGLAPETPEALMRSRYTAYVRGAAEYLWVTHHPDHRPERASLDRAVLGAAFVRLVVHEASGDHVRFEALARDGHLLRERSRFARVDGRWTYVDGDVSTAQIARGAPCPCGSGDKFKRCCGA